MSQVTPLSPEARPAPKPKRSRWWPALLTAAAGIAVGLLGGITTSTGEPEASAPTTGAAETSTAPPRPASLSARVPGFTGTLAWVNGEVPFTGLTWDAGDTEGTGFTLPGRTRGAAWNADATRAAAFVSGELVDSLSVLVDGAMVTVAVDVADFSWHGTDPARIAWIDTAGRIWTAAAPRFEPEPAFGDSRIRQIVSWGDWGFALQMYGGFDDPVKGFVQTRTTHNRMLGRTDNAVVAVSGDGAFMLRRPDETLELAGPDLTPIEVMRWATISNVAWSPVGEEIAGLVDRGGSINLELRRDTAVFEYRLSALDGYIAGWSADGRFIAVVSFSVIREGARGPGIIIVDLFDRSTHVFAVDARAAAIW